MLIRRLDTTVDVSDEIFLTRENHAWYLCNVSTPPTRQNLNLSHKNAGVVETKAIPTTKEALIVYIGWIR